MSYTIKKTNKSINGTMNLTASKSESNRVLIIQALCEQHFKINNLANADDTKILLELLSSNQYNLDVGAAGTTMRFLTAYLATKKDSEHIITGSKRMQERPIGILIDALNQLGAEITYTKNIGFPPIKIVGKKLTGDEISIDGSISSQYITALLLIAPTLEKGLKITIQGILTSKPYVEMTLKIMNYFNIKTNFENNLITIESQKYKAKNYTIEGDWSSASYLYQIVAFYDNAELFINGLNQDSLQGDSKIRNIMSELGVKTEFKDQGIKLTKTKIKTDHLIYDFSDCPDIAQTIAVTCVGLGIKATLSGLKTLKIKETDRVKALINEISKLGINISESQDNTLLIQAGKINKDIILIETYKDHRMAMAFAPLAMLNNNINIQEPEVVAKSYPDFWQDLAVLGLVFTDT